MQKIFFNYRQEDSTFDLTTKLAGILPEGVYQGLDFEATANLSLRLSQANGKQYLLADGTTLSNKYGVAVNKQGSVFITDETYNLAITAPASNPRIDLVILTHKYVEVEGGDAPLVSIIQGTEAAIPTAPALTSPNEQTELGHIYLPAGISALTDSGVVYTKKDATLYNPQNFDGSQYATFTSVEQLESDFADFQQEVAQTYAALDQQNDFTATQHLGKGATQLAPDGSGLVTISTFDGNFYRIGAGTLSGITAIREGTSLKFRVIGNAGLLLKHNISVSDPRKKILIAGGEDVFLQENDVFTLVEDSDGWIVEGLPISHRVPAGKYVEMFAGTVAEIPSTHALCDGTIQNGIQLPDLRGSFVVGFDSSDADYDTIGNTGGAKEVTLTDAQTPLKEHQHDSRISYYQADSATYFTLGDAQLEILNTEPDDTVATHTVVSDLTGDSSATGHENRPPYYTLAYIMRIK